MIKAACNIGRALYFQEEFTIQYLLAEPESLYLLNRLLGQFELAELTLEDFQEGDLKHLFNLVKQALAQDDYEPIDYVEMNLGDDFALPQLSASESQSLSDTQSKQFKDRLRSILLLRQNKMEERSREIYFLQNEAEEKAYSNEEANLLYVDMIETRRKIDFALQSPESGGSGLIRGIPRVNKTKRKSNGATKR